MSIVSIYKQEGYISFQTPALCDLLEAQGAAKQDNAPWFLKIQAALPGAGEARGPISVALQQTTVLQPRYGCTSLEVCI